MSPQQVFKSTLVVLLTLLGAYILLIGMRIIVVLAFAVIIASALRPLVDRLNNWRIPRGIAIVAVYAFFITTALVAFAVIASPIVNQIAGYIENENRLVWQIVRAKRWLEDAISLLTGGDIVLASTEDIRAAVATVMADLRGIMPNAIENISTIIGETVLIFVMGAYWLTSHNKAIVFITQLFRPGIRDKVRQIIEEIEETLGSYVRGQITIALIVGILNIIVLTILGVPGALTVAFIIAFTSTIPMIGGLVGGIGATAITLITFPEYTLIVFVVFFVIQQIESHLLGPYITSNSVQLDPLLVIVYTAVGFILFGILGALIAVPVMGMIHILLQHLVIKPHRESQSSFQVERGIPLVKAMPGMLDSPTPSSHSATQPEDTP